MKQYLAIALFLLPVCAQPKPVAANTTPAKAVKPIAKSAAALNDVKAGVPAGAVEVSPNLYKLADKTGKVWFYQRNPFGVLRFEQTPEQAALDPKMIAQVPDTQVTEQGDSLKFVRPGPFGNYTWMKKKTDLDESEQAAYQTFQSKATGHADPAIKVEAEPTQPATKQNKGQ